MCVCVCVAREWQKGVAREWQKEVAGAAEMCMAQAGQGTKRIQCVLEMDAPEGPEGEQWCPHDNVWPAPTRTCHALLPHLESCVGMLHHSCRVRAKQNERTLGLDVREFDPEPARDGGGGGEVDAEAMYDHCALFRRNVDAGEDGAEGRPARANEDREGGREGSNAHCIRYTQQSERKEGSNATMQIYPAVRMYPRGTRVLPGQGRPSPSPTYITYITDNS